MEVEEKTAKLTHYGISSEIANKATSAGLTTTKAKTITQEEMAKNYRLTEEEVQIVCNAVKRIPIKRQVAQVLLERSNFLCNVCKGDKSHAFVIHHIEEYESTQDNSYENLIVLCPSDHDAAHHGGLSLKIKKGQLKQCKASWEKQVEIGNARKAAQQIEIVDDAIDYVNVRRIEELCVRLFNRIPDTTISNQLKSLRILRPDGSFDQGYVKSVLSGGRYLFDYSSSREPEHFKQLLQQISRCVNFVDLDVESNGGFEALRCAQGSYAFFTGGVYAKGPEMPINNETQPVVMYYQRKRLKIEWILDPMFLMSSSAIGRIGGKNRYIIYCLVRTVEKSEDGTVLVKAGALLIAQPRKFVDKTPVTAYRSKLDVEI